MALIRSAALAGLAYLVIALSYPDWDGQVYHVMVLSLIGGGAVGLFFLFKVLDLTEGFAKIAIEAAFVIGVAFFVAYTMPQKSGKPPLQQWAEGVKPNRAAARNGLDRLGINPNGAVASKLVDLFPR